MPVLPDQAQLLLAGWQAAETVTERRGANRSPGTKKTQAEGNYKERQRLCDSSCIEFWRGAAALGWFRVSL